MTEEMKIRPATATLSVVTSEDGKAWQAQFTFDGRVDRVLRFERKQDAETWINLKYHARGQPLQRRYPALSTSSRRARKRWRRSRSPGGASETSPAGIEVPLSPHIFGFSLLV
jgi:hypothetical protein